MSGKISGIYVEIKGDASQLKKELKDARQLITEQAHGMSNALANALSPAQIGKSTRALLYDLNSLANASKLTGKEFGSLGVDLKELQRLTGITEQQFQSLQSRMLQTATATAQEKALKGIATAAGLTDVEIRKLAQQMGVGEASLAKLVAPAKAVVVELSQMQKSVNQAAASLSALSKGGGLGAISQPLAALAANSRLSEAELAKLQGRLVAVQSAKAQEQAIRAIGAATGMTADQMAALGHKMGVSASVMRSLVESARPAATAISSAQVSVNQLATSLSALRGGKAGLGDVTTSLSVLAANSGLSGAELAKLQSRMLQTSAAKAQENALRDVARAANLTESEVRKLGAQMGVSAASMDRVLGVSAVVATKMDGTAGASKDAGSAMGFLAGAAQTAVGVFSGLVLARLTQELIEFAPAVIDAGIAFDALERSMAAVTGGQTAAAETLQFLREESERLGQNFYNLAPEFKNLAAAARGTAMEGENVREMFSAIAGASTALGLSADDTHGTLRALQQMMSKGKIQAEELRGQLGERLPGALNLMARGMGVSTAELNKMMEQGQLLADDALPKLTVQINKMYQAAAEKAALESGQAAVNKLSQAWTDLKVNLFDADAFVWATNNVTGLVNSVNSAIAPTVELRIASMEADLSPLLNKRGELVNSLVAEGMGIPEISRRSDFQVLNKQIEDLQRNIRRAKEELQWMTDPAKDGFLAMSGGMEKAAARSSVYTAEVDKGHEALVRYNQSAREKAKADYDAAVKWANSAEEQARALAVYQEAIARLDKKESAPGLKAAKASAKSYDQMITDGKKAAETLDKYWQDYEDGRVKAIADGVDERAKAQVKDLALVTEFADKYKEIVLGETAFKLAQIEAQAEAYRTAGADEIAVAKWVEAEKQKVSRDWQDGAVRALEAYADASTNAAALAEQAFTNGFGSMEDALVDFVTTGKMNFSDLADSIISDLARIAIQQSITGPLASGLGSMIGGLFGGGASVASVGAPKVGYAKGGVPGAPSLSAYANSIVDKPTVFPFARGIGLMGEAGPEAIMPLKRGPDGTLGVRGGGSNVVVNVIESPGNGGQRQERQEGGTTIIDIMVEQIEAKLASNTMRGQGPLYSANKQAFGLTRAPGAY